MNKKNTAIRISSILAIAALSTAPLAAQPGEGLYRWIAPAAAEQMATDVTVVPAGKGAIFAPAMTAGVDEPSVLVFAGEEKVATGKTGQRIILDPGTYQVRIGSGTVSQMLTVPAVVTAGQTTTLEPTWSGLLVQVVDTQNIPLRSTYEIIRADDREVMGIGVGADTLQGETLRTWLLKPGLYRIVRSGETFRARKDFATAFLPQGGLVHFKLVLDPETGDFRGAGVVSPEEIGVKTAEAESPWIHNVTASGALSLSETSNVVGSANQSSMAGTVFFDAYSTYENGPHRLTNIFEIEEGFLQINPDQGKDLPTQHTQDRLREDLLYTRYLNERWGPYVRFGLLTNVFEAKTLATEPITVAYNRLDGSRQPGQRRGERPVLDGRRFRLAAPARGLRRQRPPAAQRPGDDQLAWRPGPAPEPLQQRLPGLGPRVHPRARPLRDRRLQPGRARDDPAGRCPAGQSAVLPGRSRDLRRRR